MRREAAKKRGTDSVAQSWEDAVVCARAGRAVGLFRGTILVAECDLEMVS